MPIQKRVPGITVQKVPWGRNQQDKWKKIESSDFKHLPI
jgi:hypothetical protein